jgi:multiple sugar transport system permease protein
MTKGGGPNGASSTLVQLIYQIAFVEGNAGKAAALSVIVALLLFMLTGFYFYFGKERRKHVGKIAK